MKNSSFLRLLCIVGLSLTQVACIPEPLDRDAPPCSACDGRGYTPMVRTTTYNSGYTDRQYYNQRCHYCGGTGNSSYMKNQGMPMFWNQVFVAGIKAAVSN